MAARPRAHLRGAAGFHKRSAGTIPGIGIAPHCIALFGDVVVDLAAAQKLPAHIELRAYALLRDIDVLLPRGTAVESRPIRRPPREVGSARHSRRSPQTAVLRVISHAIRGDITLRLAGPSHTFFLAAQPTMKAALAQ